MLAGLCGGCAAFAQSSDDGKKAWFTETQYYSSGVNNEGQAIIFVDQCKPYEIWTPKTGEIKTIGGISAGNGIGGLGRYSDDGARISAVMYSDNINVFENWIKTTLKDIDFNFSELSCPTGVMLFAIGTSEDKQTGYMTKTTNNGKVWATSSIAVINNEGGSEDQNQDWKGGLKFISWQSWSVGFTGGYNGCFYFTNNNGSSWSEIDPHPTGNTDKVDTYCAMDFIPIEENYLYQYAVLGLKLADGTGAVWYSTDAVESFEVATGVKGVPVGFCHVGNVYFMVTDNGFIQKSEDYGKTWTTVYEAGASVNPYSDENTQVFNRIRFADENNGMALGVGSIYITTDGGATWTNVKVASDTEDICWNDVAFSDGTAVLVGNNGNVYESSDMGQNWKKVNVNDADNCNMLGVANNSSSINICGENGTFFHLEKSESVSGYTAAIYDVENDEWTGLPGTGYLSGETASHAYDISGDGSTVVGGVYAYEQLNASSSIRCDAAAWVDGSFIDLGNKFAAMNRASMAYKASYDGSVIVGWQDHHGPWFSSVWRKNADGGYDQSFMFKDPEMTEDDLDTSDTAAGYLDMQSKLLGMCNAVSSDGKIIGGRGNSLYAVEGAWLWSEEKGLQLLNPEEGADDMVYDMTNDGSFVIGQIGTGASAWVWTEETGMVEMNGYLANNLGIDLEGHTICGVIDLSPNGRYITGWCMKGLDKYAYVVDLKGNTTSIEKEIEQTKAAVYPNPVASELHIDLPFEGVSTRISLYSAQGCCVKSMTTTSVSNTMNVDDLTEGLYILDVNANGNHKSFKVIVKH